MTILLLAPILRPFGSNQLITTLDAGHPKPGTTIGQYRRHGNLPHSPSLCREEVMELCVLIMQQFASILINSESLLVPCNTPTEYKEALYCPDTEGT
jgi:hypothetical protein